MNLKSIAVFFVVLFVGMGSAVAHHHDGEIDEVLKAIDVVPTRAQLDHNLKNAQERIIHAMNDTKRNEYERQRAITLLSLYPNQKTKDALLEGFRTFENPQLKKYTIYTLARTFGEASDDSIRQAIAQAKNDESLDVRKFAKLAEKYLQPKTTEPSVK